jgi:hypothetical protein
LKKLRLQTENITDWDSFHEEFARLMGFPDFYGRNMNAWIDCLSYLDDSGANLTNIGLATGETLFLEVNSTGEFVKRLPEIFRELVECTSFVNLRYVRKDNGTRIALVFL